MINRLILLIVISLSLFRQAHADDLLLPPTDAASSWMKKEYVFSLSGKAEVVLDYKKNSAEIVKLKNILGKKNKIEVQNYLLNILSPGETKVVKEFEISWEGDKKLSTTSHYSTKLNAKKIIVIPDLNDYKELFAVALSKEGGYEASRLPKIDHTYIYKNIFAVGKEPKFCNIQASWINASRSIEYMSDGIQVKDSIQVLQKDFFQEEIMNGNFKVVVDQIKECFFGGILQVSVETRKHLVVTKEFEASIGQLPIKEKMEKRIEKVKEVFASCDKSNGLHIEMARILLQENLKDDPSFLPTYQNLSYYYQTISGSTGEVSADALVKALEYIDLSLTYDRTFTEGLISRAYVLCRLGKCEESMQIIKDQVLTQDTKKFSYLALRGLMNFYDMIGDRAKRDEYTRQAMQNAKTNFESSELFSTVGMRAKMEGDYKGCVEHYKNAIVADSESSCNHHILGSCYLLQNDIDKGIVSFENELVKRDSIYGRYSLATAYALKGLKFIEEKDTKNAQLMFDKSLKTVEDWRTHLELLKFFIKVKRTEEAYLSALRAAELFDGEPQVLAGYIIQSFSKKDETYSKFMRRIIDNMTNRLSANELSYYVAYEFQNNSSESQKWAKHSLKELSGMTTKPEDKTMQIEVNLLQVRFYLLSLSQTGSLIDLEKANELMAKSTKINSRSQKVVLTEFYVKEANRALGKGRYLWDYRLKTEKEYGFKLPMWMLYWMYSVF